MRFSKGTLVKVLAFTAASALLTVGLAFEIANVDLSKLFSDSYELEASALLAAGGWPRTSRT